MFISVLNVLRSFEEHLLQVIAGTNREIFENPKAHSQEEQYLNAQFEVQPVPRSMPHQEPQALVKVRLILWFDFHSLHRVSGLPD